MIEIRDETGDVVEIQISAQDFIEAGLLSAGGVLLPGHPWFDATISQNLPPGWREEAITACDGGCFAFKPGSALMVPVTEKALTDYIHGGEYEERLETIGDTETLNS